MLLKKDSARKIEDFLFYFFFFVLSFVSIRNKIKAITKQMTVIILENEAVFFFLVPLPYVK